MDPVAWSSTCFSTSPTTLQPYSQQPDTASSLACMNLNNPQALTLASEATKLLLVCLVLLLASSLLTQTSNLLALGLTGAEIQADYQLGYGMTCVHLQKEVCGRLRKPTEELQVMVILRPLLASQQPGLIPC